jgi:type IV secretion system protein VirB5
MTRRSAFKPQSYPDTPYNRARAEWNDRMGSSVRAARNWRLASFGLMGLTLTAISGLIYQSSRSFVQPYYVRVAENGEPFVVGRVPELFSPTGNEIRWHLVQWLEWTRAIPLDPVLVKQRYLNAMYFMRQAAANKLNAWAQADPRLQAIGRETVEFSLVGIGPIAGSSSYQARWRETARDAQGGLKEESRWSATFTIEIETPKTESEVQRNPIGLYIKDFQWTREL